MSNTIFENIKNIDENGNEYWSARDLQEVLQYKEFRNFETAIKKAITACENSDINVSNHFVDANKMINLAKGAIREVKDYFLSRYACYLTVQNADPRKKMVALAQSYFAIQTRKQELAEEFPQLSEEEKRLKLRYEMKTHNKMLAAAKDAGVETPIEYAIFQNHGYKGLYGGLGNKEIKAKKGLSEKKDLLDHMGSTELAANLFRATQTEEKLRRENIQGKQQANDTHFEVGRKVRQTIAELGGNMPEELPLHEDVKKIERKINKLNKPKKEANPKSKGILDFIIYSYSGTQL